ncbi:hypothetical protein BDW62DRAFT_204570 [Aspergillus aurantiobrunneus]
MPATTCICAEPATEAAEVLGNAEIVDIVFGWPAVALIAEDRGFDEADIVVLDQKLDKSIDALTEPTFHHCKDPNCSELKEDRTPPLRDRRQGASPGVGPCDLRRVTAAVADNTLHAVASAHFHLVYQALRTLRGEIVANKEFPYMPPVNLDLLT